MNTEVIVLLEGDGLRLVQTPVERQVELVRDFERSGLSGPRFVALSRDMANCRTHFQIEQMEAV